MPCVVTRFSYTSACTDVHAVTEAAARAGARIEGRTSGTNVSFRIIRDGAVVTVSGVDGSPLTMSYAQGDLRAQALADAVTHEAVTIQTTRTMTEAGFVQEEVRTNAKGQKAIVWAKYR